MHVGTFIFMDHYHFDDLKLPIDKAARQRGLSSFSKCHPLTFTRSFLENHLKTTYHTLLTVNHEGHKQLAFAGKKPMLEPPGF